MNIYLLHGFNVIDGGQSTTDILKPYVATLGCNVIDLDYGWSGLTGVTLCNKKLAMHMAKLLPPDSICIGHSNGCAIIAQAINYGARIEGVIFITPAIQSDYIFPEHIRFAHIYQSTDDWPLKAARLLGGSYRALHRLNPWRDSATVYWGPGPAAQAAPVRGGHRALFDDIERWGPIIAARLRHEATLLHV